MPNVAMLDYWLLHHGYDVLLPTAYKEAAAMIITSIEEGNLGGHPDIYFFPIAYLYRHGIELFLKILVTRGIQMSILDEGEKLKSILGSHALIPLWNRARVVLENVWPHGDKSDLHNVERIIQEFHNADRSGQNFRYSQSKDGKRTSEGFPVSVNLSELKRTCEGLFGFFGACDTGLSEMQNYQY